MPIFLMLVMSYCNNAECVFNFVPSVIFFMSGAWTSRMHKTAAFGSDALFQIFYILSKIARLSSGWLIQPLKRPEVDTCNAVL